MPQIACTRRSWLCWRESPTTGPRLSRCEDLERPEEPGAPPPAAAAAAAARRRPPGHFLFFYQRHICIKIAYKSINQLISHSIYPLITGLSLRGRWYHPSPLATSMHHVTESVMVLSLVSAPVWVMTPRLTYTSLSCCHPYSGLFLYWR